MPFMIHGEAAVATSGTHDDSHSVWLWCTINGYGGGGDIAESVGRHFLFPAGQSVGVGSTVGHKGS